MMVVQNELEARIIRLIELNQLNQVQWSEPFPVTVNRIPGRREFGFKLQLYTSQTQGDETFTIVTSETEARFHVNQELCYLSRILAVDGQDIRQYNHLQSVTRLFHDSLGDVVLTVQIPNRINTEAESIHQDKCTDSSASGRKDKFDQQHESRSGSSESADSHTNLTASDGNKANNLDSGFASCLRAGAEWPIVDKDCKRVTYRVALHSTTSSTASLRSSMSKKSDSKRGSSCSQGENIPLLPLSRSVDGDSQHGSQTSSCASSPRTSSNFRLHRVQAESKSMSVSSCKNESRSGSARSNHSRSSDPGRLKQTQHHGHAHSRRTENLSAKDIQQAAIDNPDSIRWNPMTMTVNLQRKGDSSNLGFTCATRTSKTQDEIQDCVLVYEVTDLPAFGALEPGDWIHSVDGKTVYKQNDVFEFASQSEDVVKIIIQRPETVISTSRSQNSMSGSKKSYVKRTRENTPSLTDLDLGFFDTSAAPSMASLSPGCGPDVFSLGNNVHTKHSSHSFQESCKGSRVSALLSTSESSKRSQTSTRSNSVSSDARLDIVMQTIEASEKHAINETISKFPILPLISIAPTLEGAASVLQHLLGCEFANPKKEKSTDCDSA